VDKLTEQLEAAAEAESVDDDDVKERDADQADLTKEYFQLRYLNALRRCVCKKQLGAGP
jgi:hypothetical protein